MRVWEGGGEAKIRTSISCVVLSVLVCHSFEICLNDPV